MNLVTESIGEVAEQIRTGKTPPTKISEYFGGTYNWYTPGDFSDNLILDSSTRFISEKAVAEKKVTMFEKDTVLISCIGDIGKIGVLQRKSSCNQQITGVTLKPYINPIFFAYWCKANKSIFENRARNAVVPILNNAVLSTISVTFPEQLDDQIRIAHLLGKVEGLIAQRKQHLQQLDDLLKSVFLEMFGDPVRNEKEWETGSLESMVATDCPLTYGIVQPGDEFSGGIPIVRPVDLSGDFVGLEGLKRIDPKIDATFQRTRLKGGELLMCVRGTTGVISIALSELDGANVTRGITPIWFTEEINTNFVLHQLKSHALQRTIQEKTYGVALKQINLRDVRLIKMIVPPIDIQSKFSDVAKRTSDLKASYQQNLTDLEALYGALSQQAFKGELDLSRVPLPTMPIEGEYVMASAPLPAQTAAPAINLPDSDLLLPALENREHLKPLLHQWLDTYRAQLGDAAFSVESFMAAAQTRLAELHPDNNFELDTDAYEHIKQWVFEALAAGTLTQVADDERNLIQLKAVQA